MNKVTFSHNLQDHELEETLEKALGAVREKIQKPSREFRQPAMAAIAKRVNLHFDDQMKRMLKRIEAVVAQKNLPPYKSN